MNRTSHAQPRFRNLPFGLLALLVVFVLAHAPAHASTPLVTLHTFNSYADGSTPTYQGILRASDNNFYGTTYSGGTNGVGTVYKLTAAGVLTTLHSFTGINYGVDGGNPQSRLVEGSDGFLYGTTTENYYDGNNYAYGSIFKIKKDGTGFAVVYEFPSEDSSSNPLGYTPQAGVVFGSDGYLYGTTLNGGTDADGNSGYGSIYKVKPDGTGFAELHVFKSDRTEGYSSYYPLVISGTTLYGTTDNGDANSDGGVFKISTSGSGFKVLHSFNSDQNGYYPQGLIIGTDGKLYGITYQGGYDSTNSYSVDGTVYTLKTDGTSFKTLHAFHSDSSGLEKDGTNPDGTLLQDSSGILYGGTDRYGSLTTGMNDGYGTLFSLKTDGTSFKTLHTFKNDGSEGSSSTYSCGVTLGSDGKLYGTRPDGGGYRNNGFAFSLSTTGSGFKTVYDFSTGFVDGTTPYYGSLILGPGGSYYGTTYSGGVYSYGTVFSMTPSGTVSILHHFSNAATYSEDGGNPYGGLLNGPGGTLLGTTFRGGTYGEGIAFSIDSANNFTTIDDFGERAGSQLPSSLVRASDGTLYGTAYYGGRYNFGCVFKLSADGTETVIYSFKNTADAHGSYPNGSLIIGTDGNLYGTTYQGGNNYGTVYKLTTAGVLTTLHSFKSDGTEGTNPYSGVFQGTDGNFYGTTYTGGVNSGGTAYSLKMDGTGFKVLHSFGTYSTGQSYPADGYNPYAGLVQGTDGKLYGTTSQYGELSGDTSGSGTTFSMKTDGSSFSVLHTFKDDGTEGGTPYSALFEGPDGNFYGTTYNGGVSPFPGTAIAGSVYKLSTLLPLVSGFTPTSGAAGTSVVISGVNFTGTTAVKFGTASTTAFTVNSDTKITVPVPASALTGPISVTTPKATNTSTATFTVLPSISSFSPSGGNAGTTVTINGGGFVSGATVKFGSKTATSVSFVSSTQIKAVAPSGVTTGQISVTVPSGTATSADSFQVVPAPTITSFSPTSGPVGTTVTIVGTNLDTVTAVKFDGTTATQFIATDSMHISAKVPTGAKTGKISVVNPSATATSSGSFTVN